MKKKFLHLQKIFKYKTNIYFKIELIWLLISETEIS